MVYRALTILLAVLFLFGAAVQYNDPDPLPWIAIYLAAAAVCLLAAFHRLPWLLAAVVAAIALVWALTLAPRVFPDAPFARPFVSWEMKNETVELAREMYGLLIIFLANGALAVVRWRSSRNTTSHAR